MTDEQLNNESASPVWQALRDKVADAMGRHKVPGVAVGILLDGQEFTAGFGVTSVENPLPVDAGTLFQIGSITKTVTATAVMRLVEMGRLDLDAPVRTYLPQLRLMDAVVATSVTPRDLLQHAGGWAGDFFVDTGRGDDALEKAVAHLADLPQLTPRGALYSYNNAGFYLLGRLVEVITGKTYETAASELVLEPAGLKHSFFFPEQVMTYRFVVGHETVGYASPRVARPWALARAEHAIGGLVSCAGDLLRYAAFQMSDGAGGLASESLAQMHTPRFKADVGRSVGLSWFIQPVAGVNVIMHTGGTHGQKALLQFIPSRHFALTLLVNADTGGDLMNEVSAWILDHYMGLREPPVTLREPSPAQLDEYLGMYCGALASDDVELYVHAGKWLVQFHEKGGFPDQSSPPSPNPPPLRLALCDDDVLIITDDLLKNTRGEFIRNADGKIEWLRIQGRLRRKTE